MGLLSLGTPLEWAEATKLAAHIRKHGIDQFLSVWRAAKDRSGDPVLWGDELEYMVVVFDPVQHTARLSLRQGEILRVLQSAHSPLFAALPAAQRPTFHPEYGRYMIESTPGEPFSASADDLLRVELDMLRRRCFAKQHLREHEVPMTVTSFPRLGATDAPFTDPALTAGGDAARSLFLPDDLINQHVRFPTLTANIRKRRGTKVRINVPIFHDTHTPRPFVDPTIPHARNTFPEDSEAALGAALPDHIYMDAMGFGMGCNCLQVTFQAANATEARRVYDQCTPLTPLFLAITAAAPIYRGYVADVDARWNVISASVDDRTNAERGTAPLRDEPKHNADTAPRRLRKSRYDSVDSYLYPGAPPEDNDMPLEMDLSVRDKLLAAGIDPLLAEHLAHLFVRDPLVIFSELVDVDNTTSMDHFENIQSTNWQTMRFKPPPLGGHIGWRVEFRPMEVQLTDFENAAFSIFVVLLSRVMLHFNTDFYMPLSLVDENMQRAQQRDAIHTQRFYFRRHWAPDAESTERIGEYTLAELFWGRDAAMPGLIPLVRRYLDELALAPEQRAELDRYIAFIGERANGTLMTTATWMRRFVHSHPQYKHDSVVSEKINYDMLCTLNKIERGELAVPDFLPPWYAERHRTMERTLGVPSL
ncbi:glutamate--cysteine ligase [Malassezia vespertilionis]|uniref:Glutamate--cysteine ligase n=1 Tax=Malassezia vespertilionis TaxID=2020962 RepID=A0A2N1JCN7_9BASI|nr:glutamate--cysteine ligase [Malassezia vespertilionis]PKI84318.1 hypothetical protein MVES_001621 [Malassezia vespertilionis]WFD06377.1 glutamate--cysteine ligase [Malassezia vespertilionis]